MRIRLIFLLYRLLQIAAFPLVSLYVVIRGFRDRRYRATVPQRRGLLPAHYKRTVTGSIWLHAVSVGEAVSAAGLIQSLKARLPGASIFLSVGTLGGMEAARTKLGSQVDGLFYVPFDYVLFVRRVLKTIRPKVLVVLETEIWPNLYRQAKHYGARLIVVNGRISARAFPRYRRFRWFFKTVLSLPDRILAQSAQDREHYAMLGARAELGGNLKYDFAPAEPADELRRYFGGCAGPIWIAASTVCEDVDEDDVVLAAFRTLRKRHPTLTLVLAPRKPERFDVVAGKLQSDEFARRSTGLRRAPVLLLDSIGELGSIFQFADVVFMGGTIANRGGHNILEPAVAGKPVIAGPHLENFAEIADRFRDADALVEVQSGDELAGAVDRLLRDDQLRSEFGDRARKVAFKHTGATALATEAIVELHGALPNIRWHPLGAIWQRGGRWKRGRDLARQRSLGAPVISIGGIGMGGAGKTPMAVHVARTLRARGYNPAILTRGYKRSSSDRVLIFAAGDSAPPDVTGDEAQILLRSGAAHIGIAAERFEAGKLLEERLHPDVFLLDDGFQHARLARQVDIVLIDALDPFAGGALFPAGRLREPFENIGRADVIVITRSEQGRQDALVRAIEKHAPGKPVFLSQTVVSGWRSAGAHGPVELRSGPVVAFCGLGNPGSFEQTLSKLGCDVAQSFVFGDHHRYTVEELRRMAVRAAELGASALVTTEKDVMNLPSSYQSSIGSMPLLWLEIGVRIEGEDELIELLEARIRRASSASPR